MDRRVRQFGALIFAVGLGLGLPYASIRTGAVMLNIAHSAPVGLYRTNAPQNASYVSFCLRRQHQVFRFYPQYCSPDHAQGRRVLKRITHRRDDGSLRVRGDLPRSIDSKLLGHIIPDQQRGFWKPLLTWGDR